MNPAKDCYGKVSVDIDTATKKKLIDKCYLEGRSMAWIMREFIEEYLSTPPRPRACGKGIVYTNKEERAHIDYRDSI